MKITHPSSQMCMVCRYSQRSLRRRGGQDGGGGGAQCSPSLPAKLSAAAWRVHAHRARSPVRPAACVDAVGGGGRRTRLLPAQLSAEARNMSALWTRFQMCPTIFVTAIDEYKFCSLKKYRKMWQRIDTLAYSLVNLFF